MNNGRQLGFGCMRLPLTDNEDQTSIDIEQMEHMVDSFLKQGFTYFDTAYMYHMGMSEGALGKALTARHPRDTFTVATKLPMMSLKAESDQERIFSEQLQRCGVDYFDYYLLHNLNARNYENAQRFNSIDFLLRKKAEGKIKHLGFSFHDNAKLLDGILSSHPEFEFVQLQINYLDWEDDGIQSRKCYETARKHNKPVIVMEPVKGGKLAAVPERVESLFTSYAPDMSMASWAIRFAAGLEGVMTVLSGMSDTSQLDDNTGYMSSFEPLNSEEHALIQEAVSIMKESSEIPCTACQYCVEECPQNIAIPSYFALYNAEMQADRKGFSPQKAYYNNYIKTYGKASDCIACRQCETLCPQHIEIVDYLKKVAYTFERD